MSRSWARFIDSQQRQPKAESDVPARSLQGQTVSTYAWRQIKTFVGWMASLTLNLQTQSKKYSLKNLTRQNMYYLQQKPNQLLF